jgi:hypothetical protein
VRSVFAAGGVGTGAPLMFELAHEKVEALERPIDGAVRVDLEVRRRAH